MNKGLKVALTTLGCKLNFSETSTISRQFLDQGYDVVKFDEINFAVTNLSHSRYINYKHLFCN